MDGSCWVWFLLLAFTLSRTWMSGSLESAMECLLRVPDQNGVSLLYIMLEIHHSGREPLMCAQTRPRFMLSSERVLGNGVRTHVNSKRKVPSTGGWEKVGTRDTASRRAVSPTHWWLSYCRPPIMTWVTELLQTPNNDLNHWAIADPQQWPESLSYCRPPTMTWITKLLQTPNNDFSHWAIADPQQWPESLNYCRPPTMTWITKLLQTPNNDLNHWAIADPQQWL